MWFSLIYSLSLWKVVLNFLPSNIMPNTSPIKSIYAVQATYTNLALVVVVSSVRVIFIRNSKGTEMETRMLWFEWTDCAWLKMGDNGDDNEQNRVHDVSHLIILFLAYCSYNSEQWSFNVGDWNMICHCYPFSSRVLCELGGRGRIRDVERWWQNSRPKHS